MKNRRFYFRFYFSCLFIFVLVFGTIQPTPAQIPGLPNLFPMPAPPAKTSAPAPVAAPAAASAPVRFNGQTLFLVYAPEATTAQDRADLVSLRLQPLLTASPERSLPTVSNKAVGQNVVIQLDGAPLLTVTNDDVAAAGIPAATLAARWQNSLQTAIQNAWTERQPGFLRDAFLHAGRIVLFGALLHFVLWFFFRRFFDRPGWPVLVLLWASVVYRITDLTPQTRPLHDVLTKGILRPLFVTMVVGLAAAGLARLLTAILRRVFPPIPDNPTPEERTERTFRRRATLGNVARVTAATLVWIVAAVVALSWLGVNLSALLTSAGLIGVALAFAAQDTMKDLVAGVNILADDRFGVGDVIKVGEYQGTVQKLDLRVTQIRDGSGRLVTFPNRVIDTVANLTSQWAQVDFTAGVSYETNLRQAMSIMETAATQLADEWPERVLDTPTMLGVDAYNASDITLRMLVKTTPGDQWPVARELRLRVKEAFDAAKISMSTTPQSVVTVIRDAQPNAEITRRTPKIFANRAASSPSPDEIHA